MDHLKTTCLATVMFICCCSGVYGFGWMDGIRANMTGCVGQPVDIAWAFHTASGENITQVQWTAEINGRTFNLKKERFDDFEFGPESRLQLKSATVNDSGSYSVAVDVFPNLKVKYIRTVRLTVAEPPSTSDGSLQAMDPAAIKVSSEDGGSAWQVQLSCGTFQTLGHPPVLVIWTTPSRKTLSSTSYKDGLFQLTVPNPETGVYSCRIQQQDAALSCLPQRSQLRDKANVLVLSNETRLLLLEARVLESETLLTSLTSGESQNEADMRSLETAAETHLKSLESQTTLNTADLKSHENNAETRLTSLESRTGVLKSRIDMGLRNVALNRGAEQSSTYKSYVASRAVDGNVNANMENGYCSHTGENDNMPWWRVDLGTVYNIASVWIVNRQDCCSDRLRDFYVEMFTDDPKTNPFAPSTLCYYYPGPAQSGEDLKLPCRQMTRTRFVRIRKSTPFLQLCEVMVYP